LPPTLGDLSVNALAINGNYIFAGNIAAASYYGVFISSNNGSNWDTTGLIDINNGVQTLATKGDTIFAGVFSDGGVYVSLNNGISWKQADSGLPSNTDVMTFAISGNNIFAGTQGNGVYLSSNNGKLWTAVNNGLTNNEIMSIVLNGNNIFAGTDGGGVFLSTNNGSNWTAINNGLPTNTFARALAINGNYLFAGTSDGGVWRFPLSALGIKEINNNADNIAVYPNPVTNTLTIDIPQAAGGNISIYNLLGEEVYSTTNNKPQTTNNIDVSAFPGGMYIVEVKTDKGVSENKFIKE